MSVALDRYRTRICSNLDVFQIIECHFIAVRVIDDDLSEFDRSVYHSQVDLTNLTLARGLDRIVVELKVHALFPEFLPILCRDGCDTGDDKHYKHQWNKYLSNFHTNNLLPLSSYVSRSRIRRLYGKTHSAIDRKSTRLN